MRTALALVCGSALSACDALEPLPHLCTSIGIPIMAAEVRDQHGAPAAIGARLDIHSPDAVAWGEGFTDSLRVVTYDGALTVGGVFTVAVSRPWHATTVLPHVVVPQGACGISAPHEIAVEIELLPGAPPVRQVVLPYGGYSYGGAGFVDRLPVRVVAVASASRELNWYSTDTTVVTVDQEGVIESQCRDVHGQAFVVAESVVDTRARDSLSVSVFADDECT